MNLEKRCRFLIPLFLLILSAGNSQSAESESCALPDDYGKVVCRYNGESPNQLYVIIIAHRDSLTRSNGGCTLRVQAEVYKIGEWLIQNQGVELLLPEGFLRFTPEGRQKKKRGVNRFPLVTGKATWRVWSEDFPTAVSL